MSSEFLLCAEHDAGHRGFSIEQQRERLPFGMYTLIVETSISRVINIYMNIYNNGKFYEGEMYGVIGVK